MKGKEVLRRLKAAGCVELRQKGGHVRVRCGDCETTVSMHSQEIPKGTMRAIIKQVRDCIGEEWVK